MRFCAAIMVPSRYTLMTWCSPDFSSKVDICGFQWNVSTTTGWISVTVLTVIQGPHRMNYNYLGDPFILHLAPSAKQVTFPSASAVLCAKWQLANVSMLTLRWWAWSMEHCHCEHVSLLRLAFNSKHRCAKVQPHRTGLLVLSSCIYLMHNMPAEVNFKFVYITCIEN